MTGLNAYDSYKLYKLNLIRKLSPSTSLKLQLKQKKSERKPFKVQHSPTKDIITNESSTTNLLEKQKDFVKFKE